MFYSGDLQSGIAKAMQESKMVGCFVTDGGEESNLWENEFIQDSVVKSLLSSQTILLKLQSGSEEAGFLAAIFPIPKTPTLVIIKNGELKEYMASGVSKEEFLRRIGAAFQSSVPETPSRVAAASRGPAPEGDENTRAATGQTGAVQATVSSSISTNNDGKESKEPSSAAAKGKYKEQPITSKLRPESASKKASDTKYALQRKKVQNDAKAERDRILARVEADKQARRRDLELRAQARAREAAGVAVEEVAPSASVSKNAHHKECAVQVRLFDGSTIRNKFPSNGSLHSDVRPWVDSMQELDFPYNFKQVLSPLPNKDISLSEEEEDFRALGLTPSATLILVPVKEFTSAYEGSGATGLLYKGASAGYGLATGGIGLVTGALGSIFGGGRAAEPAPERPNKDAANERTEALVAASSSRINVRTLRDQRTGQEDPKFYNGNSLSFEPRKDDDKTD